MFLQTDRKQEIFVMYVTYVFMYVTSLKIMKIVLIYMFVYR